MGVADARWVSHILFGPTILLLAMAARAVAGPVYSIVELPVPSGSSFVAVSGINTSGEVIGYSYNASSTSGSDFFYMPGTDVSNFTAAGTPSAINANRQILLASGTLLTPGQGSTDLAPIVAAAFPPPAGLPITELSFEGLNDSGQVSGEVIHRDPASNATDASIFLYTPGAGVTTVASGKTARMFSGGYFLIDSAGDVIYDVGFPPGPFVSFYSAGQTIQFDCGQNDGSPSGLNNAGQVAGNWASKGTGPPQPTLCSFGSSRDLMPASSPYGGGVARGLNDAGSVVGYVYPTTYDAVFPHFAALFENGQVTDLNTLVAPGSGWLLSDAQVINDAGDIAGVGTLNGAPEAFLLTPEAPASAPEPTSLALAVFSIALILTATGMKAEAQKHPASGSYAFTKVIRPRRFRSRSWQSRRVSDSESRWGTP